MSGGGQCTRLYLGEVAPRFPDDIFGAFSARAGKASERLAIFDVRIRLALQIYCPKLIECGVLREWLGGVTEASQGVGRRHERPAFFYRKMTFEWRIPKVVYKRTG